MPGKVGKPSQGLTSRRLEYIEAYMKHYEESDRQKRAAHELDLDRGGFSKFIAIPVVAEEIKRRIIQKALNDLNEGHTDTEAVKYYKKNLPDNETKKELQEMDIATPKGIQTQYDLLYAKAMQSGDLKGAVDILTKASRHQELNKDALMNEINAIGDLPDQECIKNAFDVLLSITGYAGFQKVLVDLVVALLKKEPDFLERIRRCAVIEPSIN